MVFCAVTLPRSRFTVALMALAALLCAAPGARADSPDFTWTAPDGKIYTITGKYTEVFHEIPNDALRANFAAARPAHQERYANFKNMQMNDPAAWAALQDRVNRLAAEMNLGYRPQVDIDVILQRGMGASGNTDWNGGDIKVRISAHIVSDGELLKVAIAHEHKHVGQMKTKGGPPSGGEELNNWEVEAYTVELEASREFDWEHRRPADYQRIVKAREIMEFNAKMAAELAKGQAAQKGAPGERFFPQEERPPTSEPSSQKSATPVAEAVTPEAAQQAPPPVTTPGPTDPVLEAKIEEYLRQNPPAKIKANLLAGKFEIFADPLFKTDGADAKAHARVARTWKKVCSKPEFSAHSEILARYRWELLANAWEQVAARYGLRIELINSGKQNAYRSDVDVTVYSPAEQRRTIKMAELIKDFNAIFEKVTHGGAPPAYDVTVHDGDIFMPDPRNHGVTAYEFVPEMREAVRKLKLKVTSGGDAYVSPGSNLHEVQRQGLQGNVVLISPELVPTRTMEIEDILPDGTRQKRVVVLETQPLVKRSPPLPVSWLDPSTGQWRSNSARFEGVEPVYDRRGAFSQMAENLNHMVEHADNPVDVAKYANRGVNKGLGVRQINSYWDIYVSKPEIAPFPTKIEDMWPERDEILARAQNDPQIMETFLAEEEYYRGQYEMEKQWYLRSEAKAVKEGMKNRWIRRTFNLPETASDVLDIEPIQKVLDTNTAIESAKIQGTLDWKASGKQYLQAYWETAASKVRREQAPNMNVDAILEAHPELKEQLREGKKEEHQVSAAAEKLIDEMIGEEARATRPELKNATAAEAFQAVVVEEALRQHMAASRDVVARGLINEATAAMKDMTPKRMVYNSFRFTKDPKTGRPIALNDSDAGLNLAEQRRVELVLAFDMLNRMSDREMASQLRRQLIEAAPPELRADVERLAKIAETRLDYFLSLYEPAGESPLEMKKRLVEEATRGLGVEEPPEGPPGPELLKEMKRHLAEKFGAPAMKFIREFGPEFARSTPFAEPTVKGEAAGATVWFDSLRNFNLLMASSSAINLAVAYSSGDRTRLADAAISELSMWIPPQYGMVLTALKDFATIKDLRTGKANYFKPVASVGFLYLVHNQPVIGEFMMGTMAGFNLAYGSYAFAVSRMNNDLVEQAFKSLPVRNLEHATPVRFRDSTYVFAKDTPRVPLLFEYDKCADPNITMKTQFDWEEPNAGTARAMFGAAIRRRLFDDGLKPGTPDWDKAEGELVGKFKFELPFYVRMSRIYRCFSGYFTRDFYNDRERKFIEVVYEWFNAQPQSYQNQFDSFFDIGPWAGDTRSRLLKTFVDQLIEEYDKYSIIESETENSQKEIRIALNMQDALWGKLEKKAQAGVEKVGQKIQQSEQARLNALIKQADAPPVAQVRVQPPSWYVPLRLAGSQIPGNKTVEGDPKTIPASANTTHQLGEADIDFKESAPIDVVVTASRDRYPGPWQNKVSITTGKIEKKSARRLPSQRRREKAPRRKRRKRKAPQCRLHRSDVRRRRGSGRARPADRQIRRDARHRVSYCLRATRAPPAEGHHLGQEAAGRKSCCRSHADRGRSPDRRRRDATDRPGRVTRSAHYL